MSNPTKRASTAQITIWTVAGEDEWGRKTYEVPRVIAACVDVGSGRRLVDNRGIEFVPRLQAWYEFAGFIPEVGDYIAKGDQSQFPSPTDADQAYPIRSALLQDCSSLRGGQADDVALAG